MGEIVRCEDENLPAGSLHPGDLAGIRRGAQPIAVEQRPEVNAAVDLDAALEGQWPGNVHVGARGHLVLAGVVVVLVVAQVAQQRHHLPLVTRHAVQVGAPLVRGAVPGEL